jgi:hypothetical protein
LEEGAAEYLALQVTGTSQSKTYPMNVELLKRIVALTGEELFLAAFFRGDVEPFVQELERRLGSLAFQNIVTLSDLGLWRETFRYMATAEKATAEGLLDGGRIKPDKPLTADPVYREVMEKLLSIVGLEIFKGIAARKPGARRDFVQAIEDKVGPGTSTVIESLIDLCLFREALHVISVARETNSGKAT